MVRIARPLAALVLLASVLSHAQAGPEANAPVEAAAPGTRSYCVWPAAGGAAAGLAIAWYGYVGLTALQGRSAFSMPSTPTNIALTLGLEWFGLSAGATAGCAIWGNEGRLLPTAVPVMTGAILGGSALGVFSFWLVRTTGMDSNTDNPVGSSLLILGLVTAGAVAGGVGGFALDRSIRGPPNGAPPLTVVPLIGPGTAGLGVAGWW